MIIYPVRKAVVIQLPGISIQLPLTTEPTATICIHIHRQMMTAIRLMITMVTVVIVEEIWYHIGLRHGLNAAIAILLPHHMTVILLTVRWLDM